MTVIAAVSLFDGVMLQADCRVTIRSPGRREIHCDIAQKIFFLMPNLAVAFSGDVYVAAALIPELQRQLRQRRRHDIESLLRWIPRFLKTGYAAFQKQAKHKVQPIEFVIAAANHAQESVIERARIVELLDRIRLGKSPFQQSSISDLLVRPLMTPPTVTHIKLAGTVAPVLAYARSPAFMLRRVRPLTAIAIGSGGGAEVEIESAADYLFGANGDDATRMGLEMIIGDYATRNGIETVGGLFPTVKIDKRGLTPMGGRVDMPSVSISLTFDWQTKRWTQRNLTTGRQEMLLRPDEIVRSMPKASRRFDDYKDAWADFTGGNKRAP